MEYYVFDWSKWELLLWMNFGNELGYTDKTELFGLIMDILSDCDVIVL